MKTFYKKFSEKFIEGLLLLSSTITTLTVLLIVVFLFKEGLGVFNQKPVEEGFVIALNKQNPVNKLSSAQLKNIFDQNITNWIEVGGKKDSIILFRMEDITNYYSEEQIGEQYENLPQCISKVVDSLPNIIAFFSTKYLDKNFQGKQLDIDKISFKEFFSGKEWFPTAQPSAQLGVLPLILGTLWVSLGAILLALPLGLAAAIYMSEIANENVRKIMKPLIELLAGIPSVVYGFFGLVIIVPLIQKTFDLPVGETGLAGSIVLGIMALPTIITISEDAMRNTPRAMKEASLALGASKWQTIYKVVVPYSISGITAGAILGIGRAIGETMAVLMVTGNAAVIPHTILEPVRTIPATIAAELGEASNGGLHYKALFALGCILFIITLIINLTVEYISNRKKYNNR
ncbi:MAG: phosphate ABC transporter permease subunit PstC [Bacteroidetes bacterium RIFCSPLOWO2_12_FULL_35_15]|nr:MAG: phosphate ABC transporter permease subunit PstC [Bacteroidetes bacterium RIFCSPLOWO2_12_FULL_35_15]